MDIVGPVGVDLANGNVETSVQSHSIEAIGGSLGISLDYSSPQASRQGLVGTYYNDPLATHSFTGSNVSNVLQRVDPNVDFNWGSGSPYTGIVSTDNFLVRWT